MDWLSPEWNNIRSISNAFRRHAGPMLKVSVAYLLVGAILLTGTVSADALKLIDAFPGVKFSKPVDIAVPPDRSGRFFVVEQRGLVKIATPGTPPVTALDLTERLATGSEQGLLGIAFDPEFSKSGFVFINYTRRSDRATVVSRFSLSSSGDLIDPQSELEILSVAQPYANHNGGQIGFGPDGYLYLAMGDGGAAGDPHNHSQDLTTLLGSILRIDVSGAHQARAYRIPPDNPFVGNQKGFREEVWAWGLRNPWRFSFDPETGKLWTGDVGQNKWEEINVIERGKNYGWNKREGTRCFGGSTCEGDFTQPVCEYSHSEGQSITGGFVYRGKQLPALVGWYIFGDFVSGRVWAIDGTAGCAKKELLIGVADSERISVSSFGRDREGEIYLLSYGDGRVLKIASP